MGANCLDSASGCSQEVEINQSVWFYCSRCSTPDQFSGLDFLKHSLMEFPLKCSACRKYSRKCWTIRCILSQNLRGNCNGCSQAICPSDRLNRIGNIPEFGKFVWSPVMPELASLEDGGGFWNILEMLPLHRLGIHCAGSLVTMLVALKNNQSKADMSEWIFLCSMGHLCFDLCQYGIVNKEFWDL